MIRPWGRLVQARAAKAAAAAAAKVEADANAARRGPGQARPYPAGTTPEQKKLITVCNEDGRCFNCGSTAHFTGDCNATAAQRAQWVKAAPKRFKEIFGLSVEAQHQQGGAAGAAEHDMSTKLGQAEALQSALSTVVV